MSALTMVRALSVSLLLVLGQAASLRLPAVRVESRRSVIGAAAGLLLPLSLPTASHALSADGTPDPTDDFNDFKQEKAAALKATKQATEKQAAIDEATGAKAAASLEAKARATKVPLTFNEMLLNSVAQREAETSMTMSDEDIAKLKVKLKKAFPGVA